MNQVETYNDTHFKLITSEDGTYKVPKKTEYLIDIHLIKISMKFKRAKPTEEKIGIIEKRYFKNIAFDKPITVIKIAKNQYLLTDGYKRYLVAQKFNIKYVPIVLEKKRLN